MSDLNIKSITPMPTPNELKLETPLKPEIFEQVVAPSREAIKNIIFGDDKRMVAITGPCSIHNVDEAFEYATKLAEIAKEVKDHLHVVMRACLDKPRTGIGWAGHSHDPDLNQSLNMQYGWHSGRRFLVKVLSLGLPVAMELLDAFICQNLDDLLSYWWIGARTVTSQRLREISSGLSTSVGFKNPTDGGIGDAIEAMNLASHETAFVALNGNGRPCEYRTRGNKHGNLILRGSTKGPNYDKVSAEQAVHKLIQRELPTGLLIDTSHANSTKDYSKQAEIIRDIVDRRVSGELYIKGFLYESYLDAGSQVLPLDLSDLKPRLSITDGCDSWENTREVLLRASDSLSKRRN